MTRVVEWLGEHWVVLLFLAIVFSVSVYFGAHTNIGPMLNEARAGVTLPWDSKPAAPAAKPPQAQAAPPAVAAPAPGTSAPAPAVPAPASSAPAPAATGPNPTPVVAKAPSAAAAPAAQAPAAAVTVTWPAGWPKTSAEFLAMVTKGQPSAPADKSWIPLQESEIHHPVEEPMAWVVTREKNQDGLIVPFWGTNWTKVLQDGWMDSRDDRATLGRKSPPFPAGSVGSGIPAGYGGLLQGATFRP